MTDYIFKILILGDKGVGKSSIFNRYVGGVFEQWQTTICVEYGTVDRNVNGKMGGDVTSCVVMSLAVW